MSESIQARQAGAVPPPAGARAEPIEAVKLRHPWRIVFAIVLVLAVVLFLIDAAQRTAYGWPFVGKYVFDKRISAAAFVTLQLTVYSMVIGVALGLALAVMRLSPNPVVKSVAWLYVWIFRGTPVYVQLVFWGLFSLIYPHVFLGVPWTSLGYSLSLSFMQNAFVIAVIGLALNEAAYMAEIVRAGLLSVDAGQEEAATALGMSWGQTMTRIIIPQAMRVIIPPTGNEVISMLKTTSLVAAIPLTTDLYGVARDISAVTYTPIPLLIVASLWYLLFTSILMVGQYFLEKRFSRGVNARRPARGRAAGSLAAAGAPDGNDLGGKG
ncbi:amino acid ABC transporter permease [Amnibacterium sp. CER49]|uniref:amino acid ABC transporter permease n=1 Tax=Amnibacterium sp. CER49 TaxID=3039161 RepID=UPI00244BD3B5|nr:amino acid ABC transporter permease [Amnibacterium sp. CER49]MDH2444045.1 amino acid ABC transporter permease [Amnibacterium sp. CER49]